MIMNNAANQSIQWFDFFIPVTIIVIGFIVFIYRNQIGGFTGYYTGKGGYVDKPTPGCMLIPFALALIVLGIKLLVEMFK